MEVLFWVFFGIGMALAIATITTACIRKTREKLIYAWLNIGVAVCSCICSTINLVINH